jgi:hypothetical protein
MGHIQALRDCCDLNPIIPRERPRSDPGSFRLCRDLSIGNRTGEDWTDRRWVERFEKKTEIRLLLDPRHSDFDRLRRAALRRR